MIIRRDIPFCCQLNKKTLRADLATTFGDDAVETRKPFINSEILRLTAIFRAMDAHQLAAHADQLADLADKLKKSAKPLKKKQAKEASEAKLAAVAASLGKPKTLEEDTVAKKASLNRCASQSPPPHASPRALSSLIQIVARRNADIALFLRKLAAEYEDNKEWVKKANALKGAKAIEDIEDPIRLAKECGKCPGIGKVCACCLPVDSDDILLSPLTFWALTGHCGQDSLILA